MRNKFSIIIFLIILGACNYPRDENFGGISPLLTATAKARENQINNGDVEIPLEPGKYLIQSGDNLPALAARFQITTEDILQRNPRLEEWEYKTTLPPGESLTIHTENIVDGIKPEVILPNSLFIFGLREDEFDIHNYLGSTNGWFRSYVDNSSGNAVTGEQILIGTAENYSISPRLLLAILEFQLNAISSPDMPNSFFLGSFESNRKTLGRQLSWAANQLNNGYYGWREGDLVSIQDANGTDIQVDPSTNAASMALKFYFSKFLGGEEFQYASSPDGFTTTYQALFGAIDWVAEEQTIILPAALSQPELSLPFQPGLKWAYTGGPHSGWGSGFPLAAIDFAPPAEFAGCDPSPHWATAMADGVIARSEGGSVSLDLDMDGNQHTGWVIFYLHIDPKGSQKVGANLKQGDQVGHPSCVGGGSSGRNLHIARLYNGEWIPAGGVIPLVLDGWQVIYGEREYKGELSKDGKIIRSSSQGEGYSQLTADSR